MVPIHARWGPTISSMKLSKGWPNATLDYVYVKVEHGLKASLQEDESWSTFRHSAIGVADFRITGVESRFMATFGRGNGPSTSQNGLRELFCPSHRELRQTSELSFCDS